MTVMSRYEQDAWDKLTRESLRRRNRPMSKAAEWVAHKAQAGGDWARQSATGAKIMNASEAGMAKAMEGLYKGVVVPTLSTVNVDKRLERARKAGLHAGSGDELRRRNDLERVDKGLPRHRYTAALVGESLGSAVVVTGTEVATSVSAGTTAGVAVAAVAFDAAATVSAMAKAVGEVAAHYGYDVNDPDEQRFLLGVLNFTTASGMFAKNHALRELSALTQQMMRRATWKELERSVLVKVIQRVFTSLGFRITQRKLAQVVPIAGALVNAGLAMTLMEGAVDGAWQAYRLRLLTEKHGLDPESWVTHLEDLDESGESDETIITIDVLPEDERGEEEAGNSPST